MIEKNPVPETALKLEQAHTEALAMKWHAIPKLRELFEGEFKEARQTIQKAGLYGETFITENASQYMDGLRKESSRSAELIDDYSVVMEELHTAFAPYQLPGESIEAKRVLFNSLREDAKKKYLESATLAIQEFIRKTVTGIIYSVEDSDTFDDSSIPGLVIEEIKDSTIFSECMADYTVLPLLIQICMIQIEHYKLNKEDGFVAVKFDLKKALDKQIDFNTAKEGKKEND